MIKIVAKMPVKPDQVENFKSMAKELVEKSAAEEGNITYSLNVSKSDPNCLTFIEFWKDEAAIAAHNATEHYTTIIPKLAKLCEGKSQVELFELLF